MKKTVFAATLATLFTANVYASTVGLYLGGQVWQSEATGTFGEKSTLNNFNLQKEQPSNYFIAVEHPYPLIPNIRISSTALETLGKTTLTQAFSFDEKAFLIDDDVNANFNARYTDYTLYYELFDNGLLSFDLGLTARYFDSTATVIVTRRTIVGDDENCHESQQVNPCLNTPNTDNPTGIIKTDEVLPLLYIDTNISLPLSRLSVFAQGNFSLTNDHSLYDYQAGLNYALVDNMMTDFHLTLGYRTVKMQLENVNHLYADLEFKGAFLGVKVRF